MAAVQTLHTMTLGSQQNNNNKLLYMVHHGNTTQPNCVSVSTGLSQNNSKNMVLQSKRPLAPAPQKGSVLVNNSQDVLRCKRKINFVPYGGAGPHQPASVARRNARERNRVKQVNNGFATLRQHIPASVAAALASPNSASSNTRSANKKLSKVETLRMAVEYIRSLQRMIEDYEAKVPTDNGAKLTSYYTSTPVDITQLQPLQQTPPCSEASASPTPSFSSESSVSVSSSYVQTALYSTENYENYEPTSPEDEELLDAISWWQQQ